MIESIGCMVIVVAVMLANAVPETIPVWAKVCIGYSLYAGILLTIFGLLF